MTRNENPVNKGESATRPPSGDLDFERIDQYYIDPQRLMEDIDPVWESNLFAKVLLEKSILTIFQPNGRLIIEAPIRHGKSMAVSYCLPVWLQCLKPDARVWNVNHTASLNQMFGRKVRNACKMALPLVGYGLASDSDSVTRFNVEGFPHAGYQCFSTGSVPAGDGPNILIIDDPIQGPQDVETLSKRDRMWEWWRENLSRRLNPQSSVIVVMSRWHEDDLVGRMLASEDGYGWDRMTMRAIKEEGDTDYLGERKVGDPLRPAHKSLADLLVDREEAGPKSWLANYQQRPTDKLGSFFKTREINITDDTFTGNTVRAWDLAASENKGDYTVGSKWVFDGRKWLVVDVVRGRWNSNGVEEMLVQTADLDGKQCPIVIPKDPGSAGKSYGAYLVAKLSGFKVTLEPQTGSKEVRAQALSSQVSAGNVSMLRADWNRVVLDEMMGFPSATHDDIIDSLSSGFNFLAGKKTMKVDYDLVNKLAGNY